MARFINKEDYSMQIKTEIIRLLTANNEDWFDSAKLVRAEATAIAQIRNRIGRRYDCNTIFTPSLEDNDTRDAWILTITIDIALYHLYSQTGMKDIPEHRQNRYQDAIEWLADVGNGTTPAELPVIVDETTGDNYSEFRINSRTPEDHKW